MLSSTYQLSALFSLLLQEFKSSKYNNRHLSQDACYFNLPYTVGLAERCKKKDIEFKLVTQHMMTSRTQAIKTCRGHRLPKETVHILEEWFTKNIDCPYLKESTLKALLARTNLSILQIKNWVSNRRRKEKFLTSSSAVSKSMKKTVAEKKR